MHAQKENFSNYKVYPSGKVVSCITGKVMKEWIGTCGYVYVKLQSDNDGPKNIKLHVLQMELFGPPKPYFDSIINHIDGDKSNYALDNLEWSNDRDNLIHAYKTKLRPSWGDVLFLFEGKVYAFYCLKPGIEFFKLSRDDFDRFKKDGRLGNGVLAKKAEDDTSWTNIQEGKRESYTLPLSRPVRAFNNITKEKKFFKNASQLRYFLKADKNAIKRRLENETSYPLGDWSMCFNDSDVEWRIWDDVSLWGHPLRGNIRPYLVTCPNKTVKLYRSLSEIKRILFSDLTGIAHLQRAVKDTGKYRGYTFDEILINPNIERSLPVQ